MIKKIQLLRNVGLFDSVVSAAFIELARLTMIYAENGRGKTTLASILRSLATGDPIPIQERQRLAATNPPHVVLECEGGPPPATFEKNAWNRTLPDMAVFDDIFVDQNVYSGLEVAPGHRERLHELILGTQGVILARNVEALADEIDAHNGALRTKSAAIPAASRGALSVDDFCALASRSDVDAAIEAADRDLAAVRAQDPIRTTPGFDPLAVPAFDLAVVGTLLEKGLADLEATAAATVQAHLARLGDGGETWVAEGMRRNGRSTACPFCAQDLQGSSVINHYRAFFSQAYTFLKTEIARGVAEVIRVHADAAIAGFERSVRVVVERRQFWSRFAEIPEVAINTGEIAAAWALAREKVLSLLKAKQAAPLDQVAIDAETRATVEAFDQKRQSILALNAALQRVNTEVSTVKERAAGGNVAALTADLARLKAVKARHEPTTAALCDDYLQGKQAKSGTDARHKEARASLDRHRESVFPAYQVAINEYLRRFNAGFRIENVKPSNPRGRASCNYCLVINETAVAVSGEHAAGTPAFKNTLSAGDRNTLALAFFFASLDLDPTLAQKTVVIDDPMTSLDEHRTLSTVQEVRRLAGRAKQVIVLCHDKAFLCKVWQHCDKSECSTLAVVRDEKGSTIERWEVSEDAVTEYDRQHARLRAFAKANTGNMREVAQDLRFVMEGYLRRACPEHFLPGDNLAKFRREKAAAVLPPGPLARFIAISEYAERFHHETGRGYDSEAINDRELKQWAEEVLDFVKVKG